MSFTIHLDKRSHNNSTSVKEEKKGEEPIKVPIKDP